MVSDLLVASVGRGLMVVGLTGGIGSGKSTAALMLADLGATVVDADALAHEILSVGSPVLAQVRDAFGGSVMTQDGALDRPALAAGVFGDRAALKRLELMVHPHVAARAAKAVVAVHRGLAGDRAEQSHPHGTEDAHDRILVYDAALLFETRAYRYVDRVVVVRAPVELRIERLRRRQGMMSAEAAQRIRSQADDTQRVSAAHHVIDNDSDLIHLQAQVKLTWEKLRTFFHGS